MCGICGYINLDKKPITDLDTIKNMAASLTHRGPDDEGFFVKDNVALGHRRLSVIDLETGHQPLFNKERDLAIVYNGEAYNFPELKEVLLKKGYEFRTSSDTEVVLNAFDQWDSGAFEKINGMFSLAIWDDKEKKLILARDRFGKKPLYYARFENVFLFASEIKSILKHPSVKKEIDTGGMLKYFAYDYIPNPHTIFKNISKLEPGYYALLSENRLEKNRYWNIRFDESHKDLNIGEYEETFRELLKKSVKRRLISDVPLGVFLSGGLDSSCVVAMMAELMPSKSIKTFTIGFKDRRFDESGDARIVADHFKTDHYEQVIDVKEMLDVLPHILGMLDEPFADYSIIPTYIVSRFARKYVTVALGGDGGDEFFAGYPSFIAHKISRVLRKIPFSTASLAMASKVAGGRSSYMTTGFKLRRYQRGMDYPEAIRHQVWIGSFPPNEQMKLLSHDFRKFLKDESLYDESYHYMKDVEDLNYINRVNYLYAKTYMTDDILTKVDRASMAVSLEVRAPFLDPDFIRFATSIPTQLKLKGFTNKYIVKRAMAGRLPSRILHKPKHGFAAPVGQWFKKELKGLLLDVFDKSRIERQDIFNFEYIDYLLNSHLSGKIDYSREIWSLFVFQMWYKRWFLNEKI